MKVVTFNCSLNLTEKSYDNWKSELLKKLNDEEPDIIFLQECYGYRLGLISQYVLKGLRIKLESFFIFNAFIGLLGFLMILEGWIYLLINLMFIKLISIKLGAEFKINIMPIFQHKPKDDFLCFINHKYDIFGSSTDYQTLQDDGLYILIKKQSNINPIPDSVKVFQYSVNNGSNQLCMSLIVEQEINKNHNKIILFNTHLCYSEDKLKQLNELKQFINDTVKDESHIIAGDLELDYNDTFEAMLINKFIKDTTTQKDNKFFNYITNVRDNSELISKPLTKQTDYILYSFDFENKYINTKNFIPNSEHLALVMNLMMINNVSFVKTSVTAEAENDNLRYINTSAKELQVMQLGAERNIPKKGKFYLFKIRK